jgi:hypothetical protein
LTFATLTSALGESAVLNARVRIPHWGVPSALVTLREDDIIVGAVVLTIGPLVLQMTVRRGAAFVGRGQYRLFGGSDGWSTTIPAASYRNPQTALSTLAEEAAALVKERIFMDTNGERVVGTYVRSEGPASRVLDIYSPERWWVEIDGTTHVGDRVPLPSSARVLDFDPGLGVATIADDDAIILPGQAFDSGGVVGSISTVFHDLQGGALRTEAYLQ